MNPETYNLLRITAGLFIHAGYDYLGWNVILGEPSTYNWKTTIGRWALLFRLVKLLLDFPVTLYLAIFVWCIPYQIIIAFYVIKWCAGCDGIYIGIWKLLHPGKAYSKYIYWMWWTPLGAYRTVRNMIKYRSVDVIHQWLILRGELAYKEFVWQLVIGIIAGIGILIIIPLAPF